MPAYQSPIAPGRSWYEDSIERPTYPALDGSRKVDVLVVGGGFTGLSAALHLARTGVDVAVLEAHRFGDGASGRNGGQMGTGQRLWPMEIEAAYGFERSKALFDLAEEAKAHLTEFITANGIDADYREGQLSVVHKRRYLKDYRAQVEELTTRYAYPHVSFMDADETADRLGSRRYFGGIRDTGTGHINPMKLVVGSARVAAEAGAQLFENSHVERLDRRDGRIVAVTAHGEVSAERVLIATNAYGGGLDPQVDAHVMPIGSFIGATEPLADPDAVLPGGESCDDSRFVVRYFRKSGDGRLLFGGREAYTSATGDIGRHIRKQIAEVYPHLADVRLSHAWGGSVGITMERLPYVRSLAPGITTIGGFSGHGVMLANFAGRLYAERVNGNRDRLADFEALRIPAFPGGRRLRAPLLFLAMTWFSLRDRF
ncbi:NAD(P)/FAD-dependent oxidoreductase [Aurantimonas coralicida]|uniref:NAD(P)/FAD-dependent oxidoreductase n=1 Tax=Aurantimonas coralicida TaxID=182270 RepID=UPI002383C1DD|nr:FAD-binding oxidoreductase [Aurantimonas coralicida]MDE0922883.1 FAD-binding oxidoreductase [Aurantimonas coralicida]